MNLEILEARRNPANSPYIRCCSIFCNLNVQLYKSPFTWAKIICATFRTRGIYFNNQGTPFPSLLPPFSISVPPSPSFSSLSSPPFYSLTSPLSPSPSLDSLSCHEEVRLKPARGFAERCNKRSLLSVAKSQLSTHSDLV